MIGETAADLGQEVALTVIDTGSDILIVDTRFISAGRVGTGSTFVTERHRNQAVIGNNYISNIAEVDITPGNDIPVTCHKGVFDILGEIHGEIIHLAVQRQVIPVRCVELEGCCLVNQGHNLIPGRVAC